jgi:uncharacterized protein YbjT (DUF2867 family)
VTATHEPGDPGVAARRAVLLAGASGLVGGELLRALLADDRVSVVVALVRRPLALRDARLREIAVDFARLPSLPPIDEVYLALGTTLRTAGSRAAFAAVDRDATLAVAHAARAAGARRAGLVSAIGADAKSTIFYNRIKGETEDALRATGFDGLVIARPSLLLGDRAALGQPARPVESLFARLDAVLRQVAPRAWRPIAAADVAHALARAVPAARGVQILPSALMQP